MTRAAQRVVGIVVLLVLGILSLPAAASVLDGEGTENWIVPVQLLAMAAIGARSRSRCPGWPARARPPGAGR